MALIFNRLIKGTLDEFLSSDPSTKKEGTIFETSLGGIYKVISGIWVNQNPVLPTIETVYTKFMPLSEQSGLTFGDGFWTNVFAELVGDGSMLYYTKSNTSGTHVGGYFGVTDFARPDLFPKIQIMMKVDNVTTSNSVFVGMLDDAVANADTNTAGFVPDAKVCIGFGAKYSDTNWQIYHNDGSSTLQAIDTGIARATDIYDVIIQYLSATSVLIRVSDVNATTLYENILTSEIPVDDEELRFTGFVINEDTAANYGLYIYDHVYLEKRIPMPTGVIV